MKKASYICVSAALLVLALTTPLCAKDIRVLSPYLGVITDVYKNEEHKLDLKDSSLMKGVYFQWVHPDVYQWNVFLYQSSDINYSTLWGGHFIFDYYFDGAEKHRSVIGVGFDFIRIDMDAGSNFAPLSDFTLVNTVSVPYLRMGRYFLLGLKNLNVSLLPWLGTEFEFVRGDVSFFSPFPPTPGTKKEKIDDLFIFPMVGLNLKALVYHFLEGEVKYSARFDSDHYLSDVSVLANIFLSRHWGLSYRFKYMENIDGSIAYNIWGLAYVF